MAFVSTDEIRTPGLMVRSQSSVDGSTPQLAFYLLKSEALLLLIQPPPNMGMLSSSIDISYVYGHKVE